MNPRKLTLVPVAAALLGALVATTAQARGADAQVTVTLPAPVITLPMPRIVVQAPPAVRVQPSQRSQPAVVVDVHDTGYRHRGYSGPKPWDADGDGIPNRYDPVYNPVWDRNGNGVPDRREFHRHGPWGDRDHDGIPNRYDRHDDRRWHGYHHRYYDGRSAPYEPRGR